MDLESAFQRFYEQVYATASQRGGLVSEEEASRLLPGALLQQALTEGRLTRRAPGVLRVALFRPLEDEHAAIALLRTGAGGVLSRQSALAQWGLCERGPVFHLSYPAVGFEDVVAPEGVKVHFEDVPRAERGWREGLQVTSVERALADCRREGVDEVLLRDAEQRAKRLKLIIDRSERRPEIVDPSLRRALLEALGAEDPEVSCPSRRCRSKSCDGATTTSWKASPSRTCVASSTTPRCARSTFAGARSPSPV